MAFRRCSRSTIRTATASTSSRSPDNGSAWRLRESDSLVGEGRRIAVKGPDVDEAHRLLAGGLAEEAVAGAQHDREDLQPQLIDEIVLQQPAHDLEAGSDHDVAGEPSTQVRDLVEQL